MNLEKFDGFFAALIGGPETVMPSEYLPKVFGGEMSDPCEFDSLDEANDILGLMMRHWNTIAETLHKDEVYVPLLLGDENGVVHANDWARGFMRGVGMRRDGWAELANDEDHGGCMVPVFMLYHEHDEDPEMRPEPISPEQSEDVVAHMAAGLLGAYQYFRPHRQANPSSYTTQPQCTARKIGRNDPVYMWFGEEIQALLRRRGDPLNSCCGPQRPSVWLQRPLEFPSQPVRDDGAIGTFCRFVRQNGTTDCDFVGRGLRCESEDRSAEPHAKGVGL